MNAWKMNGFLVGAVVVCGIFGGYEYFIARQALESQQAAGRQVEQMQHRLDLLEARNKVVNGPKFTISADHSGLEKQSGGTARAPNIVEIIKEHPEYAAINNAEIRRAAAVKYAAALNHLNLPAEQTTKLKNLLAERELTRFDAEQAAAANGLQPGSAAWQAAIDRAVQGVNQEIDSNLMADAGTSFERLNAYVSSYNSISNHYVPDFSDAGVPLGSRQIEALAQALADASFRGRDLGQRPADYDVPNPATGLTPKDSKVIAEASPVLSPVQLQLFQADLLQNEQRQSIMNQYTGGFGLPVVPP